MELNVSDRELFAHAVLVSDRLVVDRSKYSGVVSAAPFCYREGEGYVVVFRYGAVVMIGVTPDEEKRRFAVCRRRRHPSKKNASHLRSFPARKRARPPAAFSI